MEWGTLAGAGLGAVVGTGSTMLADRFRWRRDRISREDDWKREESQRDLTTRRELYGQYLAALSLATHELRGLLRDSSLGDRERVCKADEIMSSSNAYLLRYQMRIIAPDLDPQVEDAFGALRGLRDCVGSAGTGEHEWNEATDEIAKAIKVLLREMHAELSKRQ